MAVYRQAGANAVEVAKSIRDLLPVISAELPGSVRITPIYDRSQNIVNSVNDVQMTLLIAFVLVVLVIFVFLGRATDTLIPAVALPLSLLMTFMAMRAAGVQPRQPVADGADAGDRVPRGRRDRVPGEHRAADGARRGGAPGDAGAKEISFTILSMTISLAAVFMPLVFMTGLVGRIFREFAVTIVVAIFASGLVSLTLTPLMCARLLKDRGHGTKKTLDGAHDGRRREARARRLRHVALVVPAASLDLGAHLGGLPRRHGRALHRRAEGVPADRRQQRYLGRDAGPRRILARADARVAGSRRSHHPAGPDRRGDLHDVRKLGFSRVEPGTAAGVP